MTALERFFLGVLAALILAMAGTLAVRWYGESRFSAGQADAIATRAASDAKQKAADEAQAATETKARQDKADAEAIAQKLKDAKYEATIDDLRAAARRGNSGMRAPGVCVPAASPGADTSPASGPVEQEGYVLMPETAESVLNAAADLRQSVLDRGRLIDLYNACRAEGNTP